MITMRQWSKDSPKSVNNRFLWYELGNVETFYTCHDQSYGDGNIRVKKYGSGFIDDHHYNITDAYITFIME
jgi:hypothetical protein